MVTRICATPGSYRFDAFETWVCSPRWIADTVADGGRVGSRMLTMPDAVVATSGVWIFRRWLRDVFDETVRQVIDAASPGPDWATVATRIGRHIPWEFEETF